MNHSTPLPQFLFRGLRIEEIAAGNVLIPKATTPFKAHPRIPIRIPFVLGETIEYAVREHQWDGQYPTSGVSTTPHFERARHYASLNKVIVKLETAQFEINGISAYRVADFVDAEFICVPEDEEVILVSSDCTFHPTETGSSLSGRVPRFLRPTWVNLRAKFPTRVLSGLVFSVRFHNGSVLPPTQRYGDKSLSLSPNAKQKE